MDSASKESGFIWDTDGSSSRSSTRTDPDFIFTGPRWFIFIILECISQDCLGYKKQKTYLSADLIFLKKEIDDITIKKSGCILDVPGS